MMNVFTKISMHNTKLHYDGVSQIVLLVYMAFHLNCPGKQIMTPDAMKQNCSTHF